MPLQDAPAAYLSTHCPDSLLCACRTSICYTESGASGRGWRGLPSSFRPFVCKYSTPRNLAILFLANKVQVHLVGGPVLHRFGNNKLDEVLIIVATVLLNIGVFTLLLVNFGLVRLT